MDKDVFNALCLCKRDNYKNIYNNKDAKNQEDVIKGMAKLLYDKLLLDLENSDRTSPIFLHHVDYLDKPYYKRPFNYLETDNHQIVVDFIASMTDDYFIEIFNHLFPKSSLAVTYKGYFE